MISSAAEASKSGKTCPWGGQDAVPFKYVCQHLTEAAAHDEQHLVEAPARYVTADLIRRGIEDGGARDVNPTVGTGVTMRLEGIVERRRRRKRSSTGRGARSGRLRLANFAAVPDLPR